LAAAGIPPETVDTVVLTHAHPDHFGGTLTAEPGRLIFQRPVLFCDLS
jgi:glyoxylase-like metal-dependent hydrolase (beta-lactamase superfamily II)